MIHPYSGGAPSDEDRSPLTVAGSNGGLLTQSVADSRALQAWASETPREEGDDEGSHKRKGSEGSLISNGSNSSPHPRAIERRDRSESVTIEEGFPVCSIGSHISSVLMQEAFDYLDAPVITCTGKDVPMPYAANLEKLALVTTDEVMTAAKSVLYR